jgi:hypothetical protein
MAGALLANHQDHEGIGISRLRIADCGNRKEKVTRARFTAKTDALNRALTGAWGRHRIKDAGGVVEISPPQAGANHRLTTPNAASPGRGDGMAVRDFRRPGWGSDSIFAMNRWFAVAGAT